VTKRETRSLPKKTRDMASAAGGAISQAALKVTHLAINRARAAVALADHAIYGSTAATSKRRTAKKKRARLVGMVANETARKSLRAAAITAGIRKARRAK
jgi:hypothetical protein